MAAKEAQISVRMPQDLDEWLEKRAGTKRNKPAFVRELLERERASEEESELQRMFDTAWESLSDEERDEELREREAWLEVYSGSRDE